MKFLYLVTLLLSSFFTKAQTRKYVTQNGSGSKDGSSWANAWDAKIFADTLNTQTAGTEIWVAKGMYRPTKDTLGILVPDNITTFTFPVITNKRTFLIPASVKVIGGFSGTEITINDRVKSKILGENITYLDGTYPIWNTTDVSNSSNIVTLKNSSENTLLDGFHLRSYSNWAILVSSTANFFSNPQIVNCYFGANAGGSYGAILINTPGTVLSKPKIGNCFFNTVNRGPSYWPIGAGNNCKPLINSCVFITDQYNTMCINLNVQSSGGFISSHGASISNCTFYSKAASYNPTPTINTNNVSPDTVFVNNCIFKNISQDLQAYIWDFSSGLFSVRNSFLQTQRYYNTLPALSYQSGNTLASPQFKDSLNPIGLDNIYGTADDGLQLQQGSTGINYGINDSLPAFSVTDILGNHRVSDCKVDVGAYEYQVPLNSITLPESATESCTQYPIPDSATTFIDPVTCLVTSKINPAGANPVTGILKVCVAKNAAVQFVNGVPYVQRHYNIEPLANPSTATAKITIYFTQQDFDNYNSAAIGFPQLPTSPTDAAGKSNIKIEQDHGTSLTSVPGTYTGSTVYIDPDDNDIIWNSTSNIWEVSFNVTGFSGFFVRTSVPSAVLSFRTKASGNWNDINTWESSSDGSTFTPASSTPDFNSNTITILNGHTVTVTADVTIDQTSINAGGVVIVNPNIVLTINDGAGTDLTITDNTGLIIKSTIAGNGSIGNSTGSIAGNVIIERYISDKRAWRLLGMPLSSSFQTIKDAWMEGASNAASNPHPGYGTHITTFTGDWNAWAYDAQKPSSSIRIYSGNGFISDSLGTPPTFKSIAAGSAYFLFVRGDRSIDLNSTTAHTSTTLRITGIVNSGNLKKGVTGTSFSLIPNPYPSNLDFDAIKAISTNSSINTYYVWDASLGSVGQYRTVSISGSAPYYTYTSTPSAGSANTNNSWRFIEEGTAFFIPGNRKVDFTEATKASGTPPSSMLRAASDNDPQLAINLYTIGNNVATLADGVREIFNDTYSPGVDYDDAKKITGFDFNLGIQNDSEVLAVEKSPLPKKDQIIYLKLSNAAPGNYQFEIQLSNFSTDLIPYLKDDYNNSKTPVDLNISTKVNFTITTDVPSSAANRFSIVFASPAVVNTKSSLNVYPNPVQSGLIKLRMTNMPKGNYFVRLINGSGQVVLFKQINHAEESSLESIFTNRIKGSFMLEVTAPDNSKTSQKIIIN